jgi:hypothetical protein
MADSTHFTLRPDSKGRITLGKLAEGISSFRAHRESDGRVVLEPYVEIPLSTHWLEKNPQAKASVLRGIEDAKAHRLHDLGDFTQFIDDDTH